MPLAQKVFNVGDLVRWSVDLVTLRPLENSAQAEALGIVRKINEGLECVGETARARCRLRGCRLNGN